MDGVTREHHRGQQRGGGGGQVQAPACGEEEAVEEEGVEAVEQDVDNLETTRPRPREPPLRPVC